MIFLISIMSSCLTMPIQINEFEKLKGNELMTDHEVMLMLLKQVKIMHFYIEDLKNQIKSADGYRIVVIE